MAGSATPATAGRRTAVRTRPSTGTACSDSAWHSASLAAEPVERGEARGREPGRLGLTEPGEYPLFVVVQEFAQVKDEALCAKVTKAMTTQLRQSKLLPAGWAESVGGRLDCVCRALARGD